jgi:hypothetical protein
MPSTTHDGINKDREVLEKMMNFTKTSLIDLMPNVAGRITDSISKRLSCSKIILFSVLIINELYSDKLFNLALHSK